MVVPGTSGHLLKEIMFRYHRGCTNKTFYQMDPDVTCDCKLLPSSKPYCGDMTSEKS